MLEDDLIEYLEENRKSREALEAARKELQTQSAVIEDLEDQISNLQDQLENLEQEDLALTVDDEEWIWTHPRTVIEFTNTLSGERKIKMKTGNAGEHNLRGRTKGTPLLKELLGRIRAKASARS